MSKALQQILSNNKKINSQFDTQWNIGTRLVNLMEEVGELSHDGLVTEGLKKDKLHAKDMGGNLSNLLYEIALISKHYNVDLDKSWEDFVKAMPDWAKLRNKLYAR